MKHSLTILTAVFAATATLGAAPINPEQIPAKTKWFLHIDFDGLRETETGKDLFGQIEEKHGRQFRAIKRMFSLNPLTDLANVTLMGPGGEDQAIALINGRFDRAHIEDIIGAAEDYDTYQHGDFTVHEWTDDKKDKQQFGAFVSDNLIAFSEQKGLLHDALDVLGGKADSLPADPYFKKNGAFAAGWARLADIEMDEEESQLLRKAEELRMIVGENNGKISASLAIDAKDRETAQLMQRVLDGIAAFAELAEIIGSEVGLNASLAGSGNRVEATIDMPVTDFLEFVEKEGILDDDKKKNDKKKTKKAKDQA